MKIWFDLQAVVWYRSSLKKFSLNLIRINNHTMYMKSSVIKRKDENPPIVFAPMVVGGNGLKWPSTSRVPYQWHSTILTTNNCTIRVVVYSFASFPSNWIRCLLIVNDCLCAVMLVSSVVLKDVSSVIDFEIEGSHLSEGAE